MQWLAHLLALVSVCGVTLVWYWQFALATGIVFSLYRGVRVQQRFPAELHLMGRHEVRVERKLGAGETATVAAQTAIYPGLILLALRYPDGRLLLPIFSDALDHDDFRYLRVWLRGCREPNAVV
jgi:hypothetical protein